MTTMNSDVVKIPTQELPPQDPTPWLVVVSEVVVEGRSVVDGVMGGPVMVPGGLEKVVSVEEDVDVEVVA